MNWLTTVITAISALLGGGAVVAIVNALAGRKPRNAEVADRLSESTLRWVEQFQEETASARREAADARREVADMRRQIAQMRDEAEQLGRELRSIRALILSPSVTLEQLRTAVSGPNGRTL